MSSQMRGLQAKPIGRYDLHKQGRCWSLVLVKCVAVLTCARANSGSLGPHENQNACSLVFPLESSALMAINGARSICAPGQKSTNSHLGQRSTRTQKRVSIKSPPPSCSVCLARECARSYQKSAPEPEPMHQNNTNTNTQPQPLGFLIRCSQSIQTLGCMHFNLIVSHVQDDFIKQTRPEPT